VKITIASDSFKGSATSLQVADAIEKGIHRVDKNIQCFKYPVADGGEGLIETLKQQGDEIVEVEVMGPLFEKRTAFYLKRGKIAIIEMANASGLPLVEENLRNPMNTTTYGTGQLIKAALDSGSDDIVIGIGGSATNDGGIGMIAALGGKFYDKQNNLIKPNGQGLTQIESVDLEGLDPKIKQVKIRVACDVDNPLCGKNGASAIFGPQKGATPEMVKILDKALNHFAKIVNLEKVAKEPGSGAAGGLGFALSGMLGAKLESGINLVLSVIGIETALKQSTFCFTGEGKIDGQSKRGKVPVGVAALAKKYGVTVIAFAGDIGPGTEELYNYGIDGIVSTTNAAMPLEKAMKNSLILTEDAAFRTFKLIKATMKVKEK